MDTIDTLTTVEHTLTHTHTTQTAVTVSSEKQKQFKTGALRSTPIRQPTCDTS